MMTDALILNRKVGIEMEGYVTNVDPYNLKIPHCKVKGDGSLGGGYWNEWQSGEPLGVEIVTKDPMLDLSVLFDAWSELAYHWYGDSEYRGSTHVHVDTTDLTPYEKIKLLHFGKAIEPIMYALVAEYRYSNSWCSPLREYYSNILDTIPDRKLTINREYGVRDYLRRLRMDDNGRDNWMNVLNSNHRTVEFRIFNQVHSPEEAIRFAILCHNIVETVKHHSADHLKFLGKSIMEDSTSYKEMIVKFEEAIGLPFKMQAVSRNGIRDLKAIAQANKERQAQGGTQDEQAS